MIVQGKQCRLDGADRSFLTFRRDACFHSVSVDKQTVIDNAFYIFFAAKIDGLVRFTGSAFAS
jgi:hypothetical protein